MTKTETKNSFVQLSSRNEKLFTDAAFKISKTVIYGKYGLKKMEMSKLIELFGLLGPLKTHSKNTKSKMIPKKKLLCMENC